MRMQCRLSHCYYVIMHGRGGAAGQLGDVRSARQSDHSVGSE